VVGLEAEAKTKLATKAQSHEERISIIPVIIMVCVFVSWWQKFRQATPSCVSVGVEVALYGSFFPSVTVKRLCAAKLQSSLKGTLPWVI
jgi:uncharacterized protein (DUF2062 family)